VAEPSLVISERDQHITLVRIRDGATTDTTNVGEKPICSKRGGAIYALSRAGDATYLTIINVATLLTARQAPMMKGAAYLTMDAAGGLIVLGKGQAASAIRIYPPGARDLRVRA
jgi:hypothetical protein